MVLGMELGICTLTNFCSIIPHDYTKALGKKDSMAASWSSPWQTSFQTDQNVRIKLQLGLIHNIRNKK